MNIIAGMLRVGLWYDRRVAGPVQVYELVGTIDARLKVPRSGVTRVKNGSDLRHL